MGLLFILLSFVVALLDVDFDTFYNFLSFNNIVHLEGKKKKHMDG